MIPYILFFKSFIPSLNICLYVLSRQSDLRTLSSCVFVLLLLYVHSLSLTLILTDTFTVLTIIISRTLVPQKGYSLLRTSFSLLSTSVFLHSGILVLKTNEDLVLTHQTSNNRIHSVSCKFHTLVLNYVFYLVNLNTTIINA